MTLLEVACNKSLNDVYNIEKSYIDYQIINEILKYIKNIYSKKMSNIIELMLIIDED